MVAAPSDPRHPGFKAIQEHIAAEMGEPMENAGAILASASRKASPTAKRKNPRLNRVKGKAKSGTDYSYLGK